ncbi:MAG: hypothetical protein PHC70_00880 [Patescibacteria group bacterium]|nr:hypothetical protein [Patescibacteria group bacterium]
MPDLVRLIRRFEDDIKYDAHSTLIKLSRSKAAEELAKTADRTTLAKLANHLRENSPSGGIYADLPIAWCMLLNDIGHRLSLKPTPDRFNDLPSWIAWAERNSQSAPSPEQASPLA